MTLRARTDLHAPPTEVEAQALLRDRPHSRAAIGALLRRVAERVECGGDVPECEALVRTALDWLETLR